MAADMAAVAAGMEVEVTLTAVAGMAVEVVGAAGARMSRAAGTGAVATGTALAGTVAAVIGTAVTGMAGVVAGTMAVMVVAGELVPRLVLALALEFSERWQRLLTTVATTTAMIMRLIPVHPHLRFGIGAIPYRAITLWYLNARFLGDKLFSNSRKVLAPFGGA